MKATVLVSLGAEEVCGDLKGCGTDQCQGTRELGWLGHQ